MFGTVSRPECSMFSVTQSDLMTVIVNSTALRVIKAIRLRDTASVSAAARAHNNSIIQTASDCVQPNSVLVIQMHKRPLKHLNASEFMQICVLVNQGFSKFFQTFS